jgi:hypothetical protein
MAAKLEECTTEEHISVVRFFLWVKGLSAKDVPKEMFSDYSGKCLSCKAVHSWVDKRGKYFTDDEEVETVVRKWLRQRLLCGFRHTGKAMGQIYQCWWRICPEIYVLTRF